MRPSASAAQATGFVKTEMRKAAMALHTRDQAPREGKQEAQKPMAAWEPTRKGYLQFLIDSRLIYTTLEQIVNEREELAGLRNTGLERTAALDKDIAWFLEEGCDPTTPTDAATGYAAELQRLTTPAFVCHFYNYYFAHTAGGRMIGKQMSDKLLDGRVLEFYKVCTAPDRAARAASRSPSPAPRLTLARGLPPSVPSRRTRRAQWDGDVSQLLDAARQHIDDMAAAWSQPERDECLSQTAASFKGGGGLMVSLRS
jgi:heme oxygenase